MTLKEYLDGVEDDKPILPMVADIYGNYRQLCHDRDHGVVTKHEFLNNGYGTRWLSFYVRDTLPFSTKSGKEGTMLWLAIEANPYGRER